MSQAEEDGELEWRNPLVLGSVAAVSLGASLIALKYIGPMAAWVVGAPAAIASAWILPQSYRGFLVILHAAYDMISGWISVVRGDTEESA